jgi:hypothetical protein
MRKTICLWISWKHLFVFFALFLASLTACKKDKSSDKLGEIPLTDAYALVIPDSTGTSGNTVIYKLTESERLQEVQFKAQDGSNMGNRYVPEGIYSLNRDFFMLSLSVNNTVPKVYETYLVRLSDGKAFEIASDYRPLKQGEQGWTANYDVNAVKKGNDMVFYSLGINKLEKITISNKDHFKFETLDISGISFNNYDADYEGHVMIGNVYFLSSDTVFTSTVYDQGNSFIVKAYDHGFNIVKLKDGEIQAFHVYVENQELKEIDLGTAAQDITDWQFLGSLSFPDYFKTFVVFNKGLLCISKTEVKTISLTPYSLSNITMLDQSRVNFYLAGTDVLDKKMFLRLSPNADPPTYTQLIVPNMYDVKKYNVYGDNTVSLMAVKIADQKELFRYIRQTGSTLDVINYQGIKTRQIYTVK